MAKKQKKMGICTYCGTLAEITSDHVFPKNLFTKPLPNDLITVPACQECNNKKSLDDVYLRDLLLIDLQTSQHPVAQAIFNEALLTSVQRGRPTPLILDAALNSKDVDLVTEQGIYIGQGFEVKADKERVKRIFANMVKGLYYDILKTRLPDDLDFSFRAIDRNRDETPLLRILLNIPHYGPRIFGNNVAAYIAHISAANRLQTRWLIQFYGTMRFVVSTNPKHPDFSGEGGINE